MANMQIKPSPSRPATTGQNLVRTLQNYPLEPIGTRSSYVGELIALVRDGTSEIKTLLESECDIRFNCKVCGAILPTARSFVIHKRQFCPTKFIEYQRKNVAIMERMSNVVTYEHHSFQTDTSLDLINPVNAPLFVPLRSAPHPTANAQALAAQRNPYNLTDGTEDSYDSETPAEAVTHSGVEVIQPVRPPADGVYRFGMGGASLLAAKKKKHRTSSMAQPKKKKPKPVLFEFHEDGHVAPKNVSEGTIIKTESINDLNYGDSQSDNGDRSRTFAPDTLSRTNSADKSAAQMDLSQNASNASGQGRVDLTPAKRSRRLAGAQPNIEEPLTNGRNSVQDERIVDTKMTPEQCERINNIKDPRFVRNLLDQLAEVADYNKKACRECHRVVVSIYNLDRHVATQHLGLREAEYSLISKELRRLRAEIFGPMKNDETSSQGGSQEYRSSGNHERLSDHSYSQEANQRTDSESVSSNRQHSMEEDIDAANIEAANGGTPSTSERTPLDAESITERLNAIIRNPNTLREILSTKDKDLPHVEYGLEELVDIQRQILDAADPYLQCCRICNKQYFDVYVLNRHVMTVHLRLPERSCGAINKSIKEYMKRFPDAFSFVPLPPTESQQGQPSSQAPVGNKSDDSSDAME